MSKIYLLICFMFTINLTFGQTILKKKEVSLKLDQIRIEIDQNNYENAFYIFYSEDEIILEDQVQKKYKKDYYFIDSILSVKENEFDSVHTIVEYYNELYIQHKYCEAFELLNLNLTNENSYNRSREIRSNIEYNLTLAKSKCDKNSLKLDMIEESFRLNNYEEIYYLFNLTNEEKYYYFQNDRRRLELILQKLRPKNKIYKSVKNNVVTEPTLLLEKVNFLVLTFEESEELLVEFEDILNEIETEIQLLEGNNPILMFEYEEVRLRLKQMLIKLADFYEANRTIFDSEEVYEEYIENELEIEDVSLKIFSGEIITVKFIKDYGIEGSFDMFDILDLDVYNYYNLNEYNTDLKREIYEGTDEYKSYLKELNQLKEDVSKSTYYTIEEDLFNNIEYDIKKDGFNVLLDMIIPIDFGIERPRRSIEVGPLYLPDLHKCFVTLNKLPTFLVNDTEYGRNLYYEVLFIPVDGINGLEMEEHLGNIVVYFLYQPNYSYKLYKRGDKNFYYEVLTSSKSRVIVANKVTDKIYYDKTY